MTFKEESITFKVTLHAEYFKTSEYGFVINRSFFDVNGVIPENIEGKDLFHFLENIFFNKIDKKEKSHFE